MSALLLLLGIAGADARAPAAGHYALEVRLTSSTKAPFVGWVQAVTSSASLVQLTEEADGTLVATQTACDVQIDGGAPARTEVPPSFVANLPVQRYPLELSAAADGGVSLDADPGPSWVGQGPDGALLDHENDGHPGATVWVQIPVFGRVEVYVKQHAHTRLHGAWAHDHAEGRVEVVAMQQQTLGASHKLLASDRPTRVVDEGSFVLLPVTEPTCEAARRAVTSHHAARSL